MKHYEHPFFLTMLNLTIERRKKVDGWLAIWMHLFCQTLKSVIWRKKWIISYLESNYFSLCRLKSYHSVTGFLLSPFEERSKQVIRYLGSWSWYDKSFFQIGMMIGDTEEHNKICGFRDGNWLYRRYVCRDCLVSTEDADNPEFGCECRKASDVKKFLNKFLDKNANPDGKLQCILPE